MSFKTFRWAHCARVTFFALLVSGMMMARGRLNAQSLPALDASEAIFNRTNLTGWVIRGGKASYVVTNDMIVGSVTVKGGGNTFLCTEKEYGDFILELEINADQELNSGVQVRSHIFEQATTYPYGSEVIKISAQRVHGYQVEVDQSPTRRWSGGIYDESRRGWLFPLPTNSPAGQAFKRGDWNQYRIECRGPRLRTWVNGVPAADLVDAETLRGFIGLQVHAADQPGMQVRFRNVRLRDLGTSDWNTAWDCRSMDGMEQSGPADWRLADDMLHGKQTETSEQSSAFLGQRALDDFTARFKYKTTQGGFAFVLRSAPNDSAAPDFSVPFDDSLASKMVRAGDWNTVTISVVGRRVVVQLNGHKLKDVADAVPAGGVKPGLELPARKAAAVSFQDFEILTVTE